MMHTRAKASLTITEDSEACIEKAVEFINRGIADILQFFNEYALTAEIENSLELSVLKALKSEFIHSMPRTLGDNLECAVREERFEDAAAIRDRMRLMDDFTP